MRLEELVMSGNKLTGEENTLVPLCPAIIIIFGSKERGAEQVSGVVVGG